MAHPIDFDLPSGRLHAESTGPEGGELVILVHGLTANLRAFDPIVGVLAKDPSLRLVAVDLRGRGRSADTGPGTYGLSRHGEDVLAIADQFGAERFHYVGWSMGAMIGIVLTATAADRMKSLTLIDAVGGIDDDALAMVRAGLVRLDATVPDPQVYVDAVRARNIVAWQPFWDAYYLYELTRADDGTWAPSTSRRAAEEDLDTALDGPLDGLWDHISMPSSLIWCSAPIGGALVVSEADRDAFGAAVPDAELVTVAENHYGVMPARETAAAAARTIARGR